MKKLAPYTFLIIVILLNSCSPARRASRSSAASGPPSAYAAEYLNTYSALAVREMKRTGIPASITLAQGMLESNYGRSRLATQGNNHFGIKCHSSWTGRKIYHDDNRKGECFRAYPSAEESYRDHSDFLVSGSRYRDLFRLGSTDYKGWAHGLKKAGYATDPKYADLLIRKIEEYKLWAYDTGAAVPGATAQPGRSTGTATSGTTATAQPATVRPGRSSGTSKADTSATGIGATSPAVPVVSQPDAGKPDTSRLQREAQTPAGTTRVNDAEEPIKVITLSTGKKVMENNNVEYIIVEEGDTFESLARRHQLLAWEITRYNDLESGALLKPGQVIYLQPKRSSAARGLSMHTVETGETMYSISQKYAIKLSSLYKMNLMDEGTECRPGQKLRIR
jgi:LysM repeat protein